MKQRVQNYLETSKKTQNLTKKQKKKLKKTNNRQVFYSYEFSKNHDFSKIKRVPPLKKNYAKGSPLWSLNFKYQNHRGGGGRGHPLA